jgi:hypothetical protein
LRLSSSDDDDDDASSICAELGHLITEEAPEEQLAREGGTAYASLYYANLYPSWWEAQCQNAAAAELAA